MIGDKSDVLARLKALLPGWYGTNTPILDAAMSAPAAVFSEIYDLIVYATKQTRIKTAADQWLDLIARDFFARRFQRFKAETDEHYRTRIVAEIFRPRATRPAIISTLTDLTGRAPIIFEPARIADTGALGMLNIGSESVSFGPGGTMVFPIANPITDPVYAWPASFALGSPNALSTIGVTIDSTLITIDETDIGIDATAFTTLTLSAGSTTLTADSDLITADNSGAVVGVPDPFAGIGAWGSLNYPDQFFVTAFRPLGGGVPSVAGLAAATYPGTSTPMPGGYGAGVIEYASLSIIQGNVTDADIYSAIDRCVAAGVTAWTQIKS